MRAVLGFAVLSVGLAGTLSAVQSSINPAEPAAPLLAETGPLKKADRESARSNEPAVPADATEQPQAELFTDAGDEPIRFVKIIHFARDSEFALDDEAALDSEAIPPTADEQVCNTLAASAQAHDLPLSFFTNLIWQESRFDSHSVSRAGARGIAQFMPDTATEFGLHDPFDPSQALPASARMLRQLQEQFGNLGLAAAAYNAGPNRVTKWLAKRATLPRETRAYVMIITGRPAESWRDAAPQDATFKLASSLPCRRLPVRPIRRPIRGRSGCASNFSMGQIIRI